MKVEKQHKEFYDSPMTQVVEVKTEGVICASADPQWNDPFNPEQNW